MDTNIKRHFKHSYIHEIELSSPMASKESRVHTTLVSGRRTIALAYEFGRVRFGVTDRWGRAPCGRRGSRVSRQLAPHRERAKPEAQATRPLVPVPALERRPGSLASAQVAVWGWRPAPLLR